MMNVSFDELKELFENDPEAAEQKVQQILEDYFSSLEPERQKRARAMQWKLQQDLRNYKDPIARMNKMVELFWHQVDKFNKALNSVNTPEQILTQQGEASVLKFPTK